MFMNNKMTTLYGDNFLKFLIKFDADEDVGHTTSTTRKPVLAKPLGTIFIVWYRQVLRLHKLNFLTFATEA